MRNSVLFGAAIGLSLAMSPAVAEEQEGADAQEMTKGEKRLAKLLEGRVAGEPVRCIRTFPSNSFKIIDQTAYVYGSGKTIYVQRTKHPERIDDDDILVSRRFSSTQLCRLDRMTTVDRAARFFTGAVFFEDFVPYTRVEKAES